MPESNTLYSQFVVKVNGAADDSLTGKIDSITVEQNVSLPDMATIYFKDMGPIPSSDTQTLALINADPLPMGSDIEITMGYQESPGPVFKGQVTSQELDIDAKLAPRMIVRALDRAHHLQRGRQSRTFLNKTDGDIATSIASECGLTPKVDSTREVFKYVLQNNQTNWEFLQDRAKRIGYELFVEDRTMNFRKSKAGTSATHTLELYQDIIRLHVRMTSVAQDAKVQVLSWDPQQKQAIVGQSTHGTPTVSIGQSVYSGSLAKDFSASTMVVANRPTTNGSVADALAKAVKDDILANAVQVTGEVHGNPDLQPGRMVKLDKLGSRLNGDYYVTSATHRYSNKQIYTTAFTVSGRRSDTLGELVSSASSSNGHGGADAPAIGIVTDNKDPDGMARVKVKFPWLGDNVESDWARLVAPGNGPTRGVYFIPEVDDEVLVAFEHGDVHRPFILGGLWNGKDKPPKANSEIVTQTVNQRIIQSRTGHQIIFDDTDQKQMVIIKSQAGHTVTLDDSGGGKISIVDKSTKNSITIDTGANKISIHAMQDIELTSDTGNIKISAAAGNVNISGLQSSVSGQTHLTLDGGPMTEVKGGMLKLN